MDAPATAPGGSIRGAGDALLGLISTRVELLGIEIREEAVHLQRLLVLGIVAAFVLGAALVMAGLLVAAMFWETHRLLALGVVAALYAIVGGALLMQLRSAAFTRPGPFQATVSELQADLRAFRSKADEEKP
jgi:uncharacterized membrane protein YqjE